MTPQTKVLTAALFLGFACCATVKAAEAVSNRLRRPEQELVAAVLIAEAGGERDSRAMPAVLEVIRNRARLHKQTLSEVVMQSFQFSCLNDTSSERLIAKAKTHKKFAAALALVRSRERTNHTHGALYYHEDRILPSWAKDQKVSAWIGHHKFLGRLS